MKVPKQQRDVRHVEMVETYNLYRSLARLRDGPIQGSGRRWKRALYHALAMEDIEPYVLQGIRNALQLP